MFRYLYMTAAKSAAAHRSIAVGIFADNLLDVVLPAVVSKQAKTWVLDPAILPIIAHVVM